MKKQKKQQCKFIKAIKKFIGKIILLVTLISAFCAAILKLFDKYKSEKSDKENPGRDYKEFWNLVGVKDFSSEASDVSGIISKNIFGVTTIDLTNAVFKPDGFISLLSCCAVVTIVVPTGTKVKMDGLISACEIQNDVEADEDDDNCLYIASKCTCSVISIIEGME